MAETQKPRTRKPRRVLHAVAPEMAADPVPEPTPAPVPEPSPEPSPEQVVVAAATAAPTLFQRVKGLGRTIVGYVVFAFAWIVAQAVRFGTDVQRRKEICHKLTERPARAVAYSYTVRFFYVVAMLGCFYTAITQASTTWLAAGGWLLAVWLFAELLWAFVLYVAALISKLDDGIEAAAAALPSPTAIPATPSPETVQVTAE